MKDKDLARLWSQYVKELAVLLVRAEGGDPAPEVAARVQDLVQRELLLLYIRWGRPTLIDRLPYTTKGTLVFCAHWIAQFPSVHIALSRVYALQGDMPDRDGPPGAALKALLSLPAAAQSLPPSSAGCLMQCGLWQ